MYGGCIVSLPGGWTEYRKKHVFKAYKTLFLKRDMFKCICGKKITPEQFKQESNHG